MKKTLLVFFVVILNACLTNSKSDKTEGTTSSSDAVSSSFEMISSDSQPSENSIQDTEMKGDALLHYGDDAIQGATIVGYPYSQVADTGTTSHNFSQCEENGFKVYESKSNHIKVQRNDTLYFRQTNNECMTKVYTKPHPDSLWWKFRRTLFVSNPYTAPDYCYSFYKEVEPSESTLSSARDIRFANDSIYYRNEVRNCWAKDLSYVFESLGVDHSIDGCSKLTYLIAEGEVLAEILHLDTLSGALSYLYTFKETSCPLTIVTNSELNEESCLELIEAINDPNQDVHPISESFPTKSTLDERTNYVNKQATVECLQKAGASSFSF